MYSAGSIPRRGATRSIHVGWTFELGVIADGSFVDHAMSLAVVPLGAPLLIAKGCHQAEREKHLGQDVPVGDSRFPFRLDVYGG